MSELVLRAEVPEDYVPTTWHARMEGNYEELRVPVLHVHAAEGEKDDQFYVPDWAERVRVAVRHLGHQQLALRTFLRADEAWRAAALTVADLGGAEALVEYVEARLEQERSGAK